MTSLRWIAALVTSVLAAGCSLPRAVLGPTGDGGPRLDVGTEDVGAPDAGADVGVDSGADGGSQDGGIDGGSDDAGLDGGLDGGRDGGADANVDAWTPECTAGATRCDPGGLVTCVAPGSWGPVAPCDLGCLAVPTGHCGVIDASNVDDATAFVAGPDVTVTGNTMIDLADCAGAASIMLGGQRLTPTPTLQPGGPTICVLNVGTLMVPGRLTLSATIPIVILATGDVSISGMIDVSANGGVPGPGGGLPGTPPFVGGNGAHDMFSDGGGGGGSYGARGGAGGTGGGTGTTYGGPAPGGLGGSPSTTPDLRPLMGGGGGGTGGSGTSAGRGGAGGGALQISSRGTITLSGRILANGGGGAGGDDGDTTDVNVGAGGGGGAGGGVLLEARVVTMPASAFVVANGGGGGAGYGCTTGGPGMSGQDGHMDAMPANGGTNPGGCAMFGANGGAGASGATATGTAGGTNANSGANGGGGGGGGGIIVLRVRAPSISATFSPVGASFRLMDVMVR